MDKREIELLIAEIKTSSPDYERAHGLEDDLRRQFIEHVAETAGGELGEMARLVLSTAEIEFERYCA